MYEAPQDSNSTSLIIVKYRFAHVQPTSCNTPRNILCRYTDRCAETYPFRMRPAILTCMIGLPKYSAHPAQQYLSYTASDTTAHRCYPIHTSCLKILTRVLHGSDKLLAVNQECLHHAMTDLCRRRHLDLDYGEPWQHSDTNWISRSGEEVSLCPVRYTV